MVKHQRRSHQRGLHSSELDGDETSDSDSGESPSTPSSHMQWPHNLVGGQIPHSHQIHRAHSFADFGQQQLEPFHLQGQYGHRHSLSGGPHYPTQSIPEHGHPMMHRAPSLQAHASYYVPEQNNPGVATLNTNPGPIQTYIPRHQIDRHPQEFAQSSPSSYSSHSRASPVSQEGFYTHHPAQAATYALQTQSPVEQQPIVHYQQQQQQQMPQHIPQHIPAPVSQHVQEQYHTPTESHGQWYDHTAYQAPVEVISHSLPSYNQNSVFHDPWVQKIEHFDDPSLQMPSARIENL